jgi:YkoY family integral membrane protein
MIIADLWVILFLVFLEGLLSFDNALALAAMVRHLPAHQQKKALSYGIYGAFLFRFLALFVIGTIMANPWLKVAGGGYLIWVSLQHFCFKQSEGEKKHSEFTFWRTVVMVELTDIAFSIDSILAAVAMSSKFYVVFIGGVLGIITMRFAAKIFITLMDMFPKLEATAFILVSIVGLKLTLEGLGFEFFHHHPWVFWIGMGSALAWGFSFKRTLVK